MVTNEQIVEAVVNAYVGGMPAPLKVIETYSLTLGMIADLMEGFGRDDNEWKALLFFDGLIRTRDGRVFQNIPVQLQAR